MISIDIQTFNFLPLQIRFPPLETEAKKQQLRTSIQLKIIVFLPRFRIPIVRNFERNPSNFFFLDIQSHISPKIPALFLPSR